MAEIFGNVDLDKIYDDPEFNLGDFVWIGSRKFVFVKYNQGNGSVTAVAGYLTYKPDSSDQDWEVTCDYDATTPKALIQSPGGFVQAALTNAKFGWSQVKGRNRKAMLTGGSVTQGSLLMAGAANGQVVNHDASAATVVGIALEDDTSTAQAIGYADITIP